VGIEIRGKDKVIMMRHRIIKSDKVKLGIVDG
jgi:hypothetical protein